MQSDLNDLKSDFDYQFISIISDKKTAATVEEN